MLFRVFPRPLPPSVTVIALASLLTVHNRRVCSLCLLLYPNVSIFSFLKYYFYLLCHCCFKMLWFKHCLFPLSCPRDQPPPPHNQVLFYLPSSPKCMSAELALPCSHFMSLSSPPSSSPSLILSNKWLVSTWVKILMTTEKVHWRKLSTLGSAKIFQLQRTERSNSVILNKRTRAWEESKNRMVSGPEESGPKL